MSSIGECNPIKTVFNPFNLFEHYLSLFPNKVAQCLRTTNSLLLYCFLRSTKYIEENTVENLVFLLNNCLGFYCHLNLIWLFFFAQTTNDILFSLSHEMASQIKVCSLKNCVASKVLCDAHIKPALPYCISRLQENVNSVI